MECYNALHLINGFMYFAAAKGHQEISSVPWSATERYLVVWRVQNWCN